VSAVRSLGDGTAWPVPGKEMSDLAYRLRYPAAGVDPEYEAASIIEAYMHLVVASRRDAGDVLAKIRKVRDGR